jgi:hypothetical protein
LRSWKGRVYASSVSPESSRIMAKLGVGIMIIAQKPWDKTLADLESYRVIYREVNGCEPPKPLLVSFTAVHEDADTAREMFERHIVGYCASTMGHYEFDNAGLADIPGYEYYAGLSKNIAKHGREKFSRFLAELGLIAALGYVGWRILDDQPAIALLVALVLAAAAATIWGAWVAPKSEHRLEDPARLAVEVALFAVACAALAVAGNGIAAIVLGLAYAVSAPVGRRGF